MVLFYYLYLVTVDIQLKEIVMETKPDKENWLEFIERANKNGIPPDIQKQIDNHYLHIYKELIICNSHQQRSI